MEDQSLVPSKRELDLKPPNIFKMNNASLFSESGVITGQKNMVFRNQSSTVRESSVTTKTVIRKKTMIINGEIVEEHEEETETQPSNKEFHTQTQFYANQDLFQGPSLMNKNISFDNWKKPDTKLLHNFNKSKNVDFNFPNGKMDSMSFQTANRTVERMMAFQTSVNGKINPPVFHMEQSTMSFNSGDEYPIKEVERLALPKVEQLALPEPEGTKGAKKDKTEDGKKKNILGKLGFGKKKDDDYKFNLKVSNIIEELIKTEQNYIKDLSIVVDDYMPELNRPDAPKELSEDKYGLFGNIEHIYMFHSVQFLTDLNECEMRPKEIANCFLKHAKEFALYRHYNRNKPLTEIKLAKYEIFFMNKQKELKDIMSLQSYLIKPTQRIARYELLLKEIKKETDKQREYKEINQAIQMIRTEIKFGNDLMALDALKNLPPNVDIKAQGDLIYREKFTVHPPDKKGKYDAMIFLFKEMIIISDVQLEKKTNIDTHYYKDSIPLAEVGLTECNDKPKIFKIWYLKHNKKNYTLETKPEIKKLWVEEIRKTLENEMEKLKERTSQKRDETKFIDLNERKYVQKDVKIKK